MCVCLIFLKVKNTHDVISNGIYEMTSSMGKSCDFEKKVTTNQRQNKNLKTFKKLCF